MVRETHAIQRGVMAQEAQGAFVTLSIAAGLAWRTALFALFMTSAPCELTMSWVGSIVLLLNWRSKGTFSTHSCKVRLGLE